MQSSLPHAWAAHGAEPGKYVSHSFASKCRLKRYFPSFQLKVLDGEKEQKEREVAELQTRLSLEEQRDEERGKEVFTLKQKLAESETARESLKKEVRMEQSEEISSSLLILLSSVRHCCLFCLFLR